MRIVLSMDAEGVLSELSRVQRSMKDTITVLENAASGSSSPLLARLQNIAKFSDIAAKELTKLPLGASKGLIKLGEDILRVSSSLDVLKGRAVQEKGGQLTLGRRPPGKYASKAFFKDFAGEIEAKGEEMSSLIQTAMSGLGGRTKGKELSGIVSTQALRESLDLIYKFSEKTKEVNYWSQAYNEEILKTVSELGAVETKYTQLAASLSEISNIYAQISTSSDKMLGKTLSSGMTRDINAVYKSFSSKTSGVDEGSEQWKTAVAETVVELEKVAAKYNEIYSIVVKFKEEEAKVTAQRRYQVEEIKAMKKEHAGMVSLEGVLIDTNSVYFSQVKGIRNLLEGVAVQQKDINVYYDEEIKKKKEALVLVTKQTRDPQLIAQATKEIVNLEKQRNQELGRTRDKAEQVAKILYSLEAGTMTRRQANTAIHNLTKELQGAGTQASFLGIKIKTLDASLVRLGGATTGIMRVFSRWRNRLLVLTFAFGSFIRQLQKWTTLSADTEKQTVALSTVATNLGLSVRSVTAAASSLSKDGILSMDQATQALKNLLSTGASLDVVTTSLDALKDAALANGRAAFSAGENLVSFTQGIKEGRSQITDNAGVMTNLSNITKKYADIIERVGYANGILIGFTKEAMQFEGARAKILETVSGRMTTLKNATTMLKVSMGEVMKPFSIQLISMFESFVDKSRKFVEANKYMLAAWAAEIMRWFKEIMTSVLVVISPLKDVAIVLATIVGLLAKIGVFFTQDTLGAGIAKGVVWFIVLSKIITKITKSIEVGLIYKTGKFVESLFAGKAAATQVGFAVNGVTTATKTATVAARIFSAAWMKAVAPVAALFAALQLVLWITKRIAEAKQRQREAEAADLKKTALSTNIIDDLEKQERILEAIDALQKRVRVVPRPSEKEFPIGSKDMRAWVAQMNKENAEQSAEAEAAAPEAVSALKEMGVVYDYVAKKLEIVTSRGTRLFSMSVDNFKLLSATQKEYEQKIGPIPQIQEEVLVGVQKLAEKTKTYTSALEALSERTREGDIKKIVADYETESDEISSINKKLKDQEQKLVSVIGNRKKLRDVLVELEVPAKKIDEIVNKGLQNAESIIKEVRTALGTTGEALAANYKLMAESIFVVMDKYNDTLVDLNATTETTITQIDEETAALERELEIVRDESYFRSFLVNLEQKTSQLEVKRLKTVGDTAAGEKKIRSEIDGIKKALESAVLSEEDRLRKTKKIEELEKSLATYSAFRKKMEEAITKQKTLQRDLLIEEEAREFKKKIDEVTENARASGQSLAEKIQSYNDAIQATTQTEEAKTIMGFVEAYKREGREISNITDELKKQKKQLNDLAGTRPQLEALLSKLKVSPEKIKEIVSKSSEDIDNTLAMISALIDGTADLANKANWELLITNIGNATLAYAASLKTVSTDANDALVQLKGTTASLQRELTTPKGDSPFTNLPAELNKAVSGLDKDKLKISQETAQQVRAMRAETEGMRKALVGVNLELDQSQEIMGPIVLAERAITNYETTRANMEQEIDLQKELQQRLLIKSAMDEFAKFIKTSTENGAVSLEQAKAEGEAVEKELSILRTGTYYRSVALDMEEKTSAVQKKILAAAIETTLTETKMSDAVSSLRSILVNTTLSEEARAAIVTEINELEAEGLEYSGMRAALEEELTNQKQRQKELAYETRLAEVKASVETLYKGKAERPKEAVPFMFAWLFGDDKERKLLFAEQTKQIEGQKQKLLDLWDVGRKKGTLTKEGEAEIDAMLKKLENTSPAMLKFKDMLAETIASLISSIASFANAWGDATRSVENEALSSATSIREQRKLGIITEEEMNQELERIEKERSENLKIARKRETVAIIQSVRDNLTAKAVEWAAYALAAAAVEDWKTAAEYAAAAAMAGAGVITANKYLAVAEQEVAKAEGRAKARSMVETGRGGTTDVRKGETSGSTVKGQPMSVTINPSVAFYGDYLFLGDTVEEVGDKMSQVIVSEIKEAMDTGVITLSDLE